MDRTAKGALPYRAIKKGSARLRRLAIFRRLWLLKTWFFLVFLAIVPGGVLIDIMADRLLDTYAMVTGPPGGTYAGLADDIVEALNQPSRVRRLFSLGFVPDFVTVPSSGALDNIQRINRGEAQLGLAEDGLPSFVGKPHACATPQDKERAKQAAQADVHLRALMPLYKAPIHIVARRDLAARDVNELRRGTKAYLGPEGSASAILAQILLSHYGICVDRQGATWSFDQAAQAMVDGKVDVGFFLAGLKHSGAVNKLADAGRFKLLSVEHADSMRLLYPYLHLLRIPAAAYPGFEEKEVLTVGTNTVVVASRTLTVMEAYQLVATLSSRMHEIINDIPFNATKLPDTNPQRELYYPLHEGAIRFYAHNPPFFLNPQRLAAIGTYLSILFALYRVSIQFIRNYMTQRFMQAVARVPVVDTLSPRQERYLRRVRRMALELLKDRRISLDDYGRISEYLKGRG